MQKVFIFEQDLTKYRSTVYRLLAERNNFELSVVTSIKKNINYHDIDLKENKYKVHIINRYGLDNKLYYNNIKQVKKLGLPDTVILRGAIRDLSLLPLIKYYRKNNIPVIIRGQGYSRHRDFNPKKYLIDKAYLKIIKKANIYLAYTDIIKNNILKFSPESTVLTAINTLNTQIFDYHINEYYKKNRDFHKSELGLSNEKYIVYIGRINKRKKVLKLLQFYDHLLKNSSLNYGLIIIGDGEELNKCKEYVKQNNLKNVLFTGALPIDNYETSRYILSSDILCIPGWLGLAVNHGLYLGLPVIGVTPYGHLKHGPEVEFIKHKHNGYLMKKYDDDSFLEAVKEIDGNMEEYKTNAINYARKHLSVNNMLEAYEQAIKKLS